ncbi:MAG: hypothetical protein ACRD12_19350 [Acidimicrobiales bacterium]
MAEEDVGSRLSVKARKMLSRGSDALRRLPTAEDLAELEPGERHQRLEALRVELYAISSILAEEAVDRAYADRKERPPYGLVRSGHTDWRMVLASPTTVEEGAIGDFYALGKAFVDTVVFHLDRTFTELRAGSRAWLVDRLEGLLALFRVDAGPATKGRLRDGLSFIYGGLHFGTGVSVQLAEMMNRLLDGRGGMTPGDKAEVIARSGRPALRLAALNFDHVIVAYHAFLAPPERPGGPQWFAVDHFVLHERNGRPWSIDFRPDELQAGKPHIDRLDKILTTYDTHGCPARISPTGATPPIGRLWTWCAELVEQAGLLG